MKKIKVDCLIIGAGLAGCSMGNHLLKYKINTLLIEIRELQKKHKLCGGMVGKTARDELFDLYGKKIFEEVTMYKPDSYIESSENYEFRKKEVPFYILDRKELDDFCLKTYIENGGKILDKMKISSVSKEDGYVICSDLRNGANIKIFYNILIGADGAHSELRNLLTGRKQKLVPALQGDVSKKTDNLILEINPDEFGYLWYIPCGNVARVGCMFNDTSKVVWEERIKRFCDKFGLEVPKCRGAFIPEANDTLLRLDNVYFIGDAAGLAEAFTGGGIHYSLMSARKLMDNILGKEDYEKAMSGILSELNSDSLNIRENYISRYKQIQRVGTFKG